MHYVDKGVLQLDMSDLVFFWFTAKLHFIIYLYVTETIPLTEKILSNGEGRSKITLKKNEY